MTRHATLSQIYILDVEYDVGETAMYTPCCIVDIISKKNHEYELKN